MRRILRLTALALALSTVPVISETRTAEAPPPKDNTPRADCAFSNPGYSGWCRQSVAIPEGSTPKAACEAVLSCLNGNACEANYCNASNIRSGWRLEEAKASTPRR
jgi:hypothetical protein